MPKRRIEPANTAPVRLIPHPVAASRRWAARAVTAALVATALLGTVPLFMLAFSGTVSSVCRTLLGDPPPSAQDIHTAPGRIDFTTAAVQPASITDMVVGLAMPFMLFAILFLAAQVGRRAVRGLWDLCEFVDTMLAGRLHPLTSPSAAAGEAPAGTLTEVR